MNEVNTVSVTTATMSSSAVTVSAVCPNRLCVALASRKLFPSTAVLETMSIPARTRLCGAGPTHRSSKETAANEHQRGDGQRSLYQRQSHLAQSLQLDALPNAEDQEHQPDLCQRLNSLRAGDQRERMRVRSYQDAGGDVANHHGQTDALAKPRAAAATSITKPKSWMKSMPDMTC
ncbi:MAG: hypothetical protein U1F83_20330 [Verrucomicrobiota bacterium]